MKTMEFRMDREGLLTVGQTVCVTEKQAPMHYYYIIEPAAAMSGCISASDRIQATEGIVKEIIDTPRGYQVTVEFEK